jgi:late competence protein required for DNA uptake (superfamily II DNA/RNA helicase)
MKTATKTKVENPNGNLICNFCGVREAVGVFATHMPISLAYCQQCLDVNEIRTLHNVHMCWSHYGEEYLKNDYTVWYRDKYMSVREYITGLTEADIVDYYKIQAWFWLRDKLIEKLKERT